MGPLSDEGESGPIRFEYTISYLAIADAIHIDSLTSP